MKSLLVGLWLSFWWDFWFVKIWLRLKSLFEFLFFGDVLMWYIYVDVWKFMFFVIFFGLVVIIFVGCGFGGLDM